MGTRSLPDNVCPRACGPRASGILIRQSTRVHVITFTYAHNACQGTKANTHFMQVIGNWEGLLHKTFAIEHNSYIES